MTPAAMCYKAKQGPIISPEQAIRNRDQTSTSLCGVELPVSDLGFSLKWEIIHGMEFEKYQAKRDRMHPTLSPDPDSAGGHCAIWERKGREAAGPELSNSKDPRG